MDACTANILYAVCVVFWAAIHMFEQVSLQCIMFWLIVSTEAIGFRKAKGHTSYANVPNYLN